MLQRSVRPVFRVDDSGEPDHEGSGVLVRHLSRHYLASAAHVLDGLTDGVHLLIDGMERTPLEASARVSVRPASKPRSDDQLDLGFVPLSADEVERLGSDDFVDIAESVAFDRHWSVRLVAVGFASKLQWKDRASHTYHTQQTYYEAPELADGKYRSARLSRGEHFALNFDHRRISGARGRGGRPNFFGMSGGGIWLLNPYETPSEETPPRLVAILAGSSPLNKKALWGSSTTSLSRMIESATNS